MPIKYSPFSAAMSHRSGIWRRSYSYKMVPSLLSQTAPPWIGNFRYISSMLPPSSHRHVFFIRIHVHNIRRYLPCQTILEYCNVFSSVLICFWTKLLLYSFIQVLPVFYLTAFLPILKHNSIFSRYTLERQTRRENIQQTSVSIY